MRVSNRGCIRTLSWRSLWSARTRNTVAILAIALTTVLFTSLFTIAASINYSYQQENFRQAGGDFHGTFKDLTYAQMEDLRTDPLIVEGFARLFVGMPSEPPFNKSHVEVSYLESAAAPHYFCVPKEGALPEEGTDQAATDTHVLSLLGVEPRVGERFTITFNLDDMTGHPIPVTRTYTLSGWWEYDSAVVANHILIPRSEAEALCALSSGDPYSLTGKWSLNVMFPNALHIEEDMLQVLQNHGYQHEDAQEENYLKIGVNWGYTGARISQSLDLMSVAAIAAILLLIIFTGYLIIYNVFQISVTNDIRFYGLLKTIGTTGPQLKRIIRQQAWLLSVAGIPIGLLLGFLTGNRLTPVIMAQLSYKNAFVSFNPYIFLGATLFSLLTVFLSCTRPGRMAAKVSPVEALRYTDGQTNRAQKRPKRRKTGTGASLPVMAWANLSRGRGKTVVTVLSLTLAVVLATITYTFSTGFDMDKYLARNANVDFILGHADYFQSGAGFRTTDEEVPESVISDVNALGVIEEGGRVYGGVSAMKEFVTEDWFRQGYGMYNTKEIVDQVVEQTNRLPNGLLEAGVQMYGMEDLPLSLLDVLEGDLSPLSDPEQNAIAAVYLSDDYNATQWGTNWAKLGDTVTIRHITEMEYFYRDTGEVFTDVDAAIETGRPWGERAKVYGDVEYTVCALVRIPTSISYRYRVLGSDEFILGAERFKRDTATKSVMAYVFNTAEEGEDAVEDFLARYTDSVQPLYDYESRATYEAEFEGFKRMFATMGGVLSLIVGLVGALNFVNAVLTGILARRREFAVLQAVGMTGKQLKIMLVWEGLCYTLLSLLAALGLTVCLGPLVGAAASDFFWFFTYRLTITPILLLLPVFLLLGLVVPLITYRAIARHTVVERLRAAE